MQEEFCLSPFPVVDHRKNQSFAGQNRTGGYKKNRGKFVIITRIGLYLQKTVSFLPESAGENFAFPLLAIRGILQLSCPS